MLNLTQIRSLIAALDEGSLSAAARRLALSQPAVSQHIAALEAQIGQSLVTRARTGVHPTQAGRIVSEHGRRLIGEMQALEDALDSHSGTLKGRVRMTTTILFSQTVVFPLVAKLREIAPELKLDLLTTDEVLDVEAAGVDLALRGGTAGSGSGTARRVAEITGVLVATPAYLDRIGRPRHADDLDRLDYVEYRDSGGRTTLPLRDPDGQTIEAPVRPAFAAQSPNLVLQAVQAGIGFAQAPDFFVRPMIEAGELERVLPGYTAMPKLLHLVQSHAARTSPRVQLVRELLIEVLNATDGITVAPSALTDLARARRGLAAE